MPVAAYRTDFCGKHKHEFDCGTSLAAVKHATHWTMLIGSLQ